MMKRTKPPNKYSLKKIDQLNSEVKARKALCLRAGGTPRIFHEKGKRNDGEPYTIKRVICVGGTCECRKIDKMNNCGGKRGILEPHEHPIRRSKGAKVSLESSYMVLRECHQRLDGRQPKLQWIKGE